MSNDKNALKFDDLKWKQASKTEGDNSVVVEVADVKGFDLKAIRATSTYDVTAEQLRARIMDMDNFTQWVNSAVKAEVIHKIADNIQAVYCEHHAPWPVKNRDGVIIQHAVRLDENTICVNLYANNDLAKEKKGLVRIEYIQGAWILEDIAGGKTKLTYQVHSDPNGNIPDWLINSMISEAPTSTLTNLHNVDFSIYPPENQGLDLSVS